MPSAGCILPPRITILKDPRSKRHSNTLTTGTFVELYSETPNTKIYFTTDGTKPSPFQSTSGKESTFKYRAPFTMNPGKRNLRVIAISRDGLQESPVLSKAYVVEESEDEFFSDTDGYDTSSVISSSTISTVRPSYKSKSKRVSRHGRHSSGERGRQRHSSGERVQFRDSSGERGRLRNSSGERNYRSPQNWKQAWGLPDSTSRGSKGTPRAASPPFHPTNYSGTQINVWGDAIPPMGTNGVFMSPVPSVNQKPFGMDSDTGFLTNQMMNRLEQQRSMTVADVRRAVREATSPPPPPPPPAIEYMPIEQDPVANPCSPANGHWKEQLKHVYAHLVQHASNFPDFRVAVGEPRMGSVVDADIMPGDDDTFILTVAISRYGPPPRRQMAPRPRTAPAPKPAKPKPKKAPTPIKTPSPASSVKSVKSVKSVPKPKPKPKPKEPVPEPEPEPPVEKDPEPYFETEEYEQEGTLKPAPGFDAEVDSEKLRKAMKGLGTNEDAITSVLGARSATQRVDVAKTFKTMYGKDLVAELKSELSGNYLTICKGLCLPPADFDANQLHKAMKGLGTDESCLLEIICTRTNKQLQALKEAYKRLYNKELEKAVESETSGHLKRLLVSLLQANRSESQEFDRTKAQQDAQKLYDAGVQKKFGTDESQFNMILVSRSYPHLRAVFEEYETLAGHDIEKSIKSEMSGDLCKGMLAIVRCIKEKPAYFAKQLYDSMKGLGTDDECLLRVVITRCEIDMVQIKQAFQTAYKQSLGKFIADDTSGDYRKILLALIDDRGAKK